MEKTYQKLLSEFENTYIDTKNPQATNETLQSVQRWLDLCVLEVAFKARELELK